jgi:hypothetical protein
MIIVLVALLAASMIPVAVLAAGGTFTDDDDSIFEADIEWLAGAGVTAGCNPPTNDNYCPSDSVTRGQMAAFMRRFAQFLGAEDGTVSNADHAATADSATTADNADTVDGLDAGDLMARWALVAADGTIVDQSGGITMTTSFPGGYYLNFGSSVEGHAILGTIKYRNAAPGNSDGTLNLSPCGALGTTCAPVGTNNTNHVWVLTRNGSGTQDGRPFYVTVLP